MSLPPSMNSTQVESPPTGKVIEITPYRTLDFGVPEEDNEKEQSIENVNGESSIIERQRIIPEEKIPKIGMQFESEEAAYTFYKEYAKMAGFGVRKNHIHRDINGRVMDRTFCCSCEGHRQKDKRPVKSQRPYTRTGCEAMMSINGRHTGTYKVVKFIVEHKGHDLMSPSKTHMLRSHRRISALQASQANDIDCSGIAPRAGFDLMAKQAGGREKVGFIFEDYKNYLRSKRTTEMNVDETGGVLAYLQKKQIDDPNFFYAIQIDEDGCIANILWIDAQMKVDYTCFGDVICFDTTYRKNKEGRPFALFVGVNHHKQTTIFGAALLYDETACTFMWLFDTFAGAMSGKLPQTILTDQDAAMAKALASKWSATCHRLCIWHIYQNAAIHLSSVFARFPDFSKEFSSCVYDYEEEEEFLLAWHEMLEKYGLQANEWLERLFKVKEKWALVYGRQSFSADMTTTQRSESMNSALKKYVSYKNNLLQFFQHFDRLVDDRRYKEQYADKTTNHSTPVELFPVQISKHAVSIYTHEVFQLFQTELQKSYDAKLDFCGEIEKIFEYKVTPFGKRFQHQVMYDSSQDKVWCSCKKFEFAGILCSHTLKVLSSRNITKIPEFYIKKRWTKKAKKDMVQAEVYSVGAREPEPMNEKGEKEVISALCKELYSLNNQFVTRAVLTVESLKVAKKCLLMSIEEVEASLEDGLQVKANAVEKPISTQVCKQQVSVGVLNGGEKASGEDECISIRGWKKKETKTARSGKRPRSGLEKNTRKRNQKKNNISSSSNGNQAQTICPSTVDATQENSIATLSHLSQEYNVGLSNLNSIYSGGSSLPYLQPIKFTPVFNPSISQQDNFTPSYSRKEVHSALNLTQLLQQQIINSEELDGVHVKNSMSVELQKDAKFR